MMIIDYIRYLPYDHNNVRYLPYDARPLSGAGVLAAPSPVSVKCDQFFMITMTTIDGHFIFCLMII